ncbi:MAG: nitroreductase family protein [Deferrisomatales bacterium]|nr:nitroreductase family protein [Deferrisomatales bacterium]
MELLEAIRTRRSVRDFRPDPVSRELLEAVVDAAHWAPSGLNNQPWRFHLVQDPAVLEGLAACTRYGHVLRSARAAVAVFLEGSASYHRDKDCQGVGACLQNLLLAAHGLGLGSCWLGEILNRRHDVEKLLGAPVSCELMAVVALGYPARERQGTADRLPLDRLIVGRS